MLAWVTFNSRHSWCPHEPAFMSSLLFREDTNRGYGTIDSSEETTNSSEAKTNSSEEWSTPQRVGPLLWGKAPGSEKKIMCSAKMNFVQAVWIRFAFYVAGFEKGVRILCSQFSLLEAQAPIGLQRMRTWKGLIKKRLYQTLTAKQKCVRFGY